MSKVQTFRDMLADLEIRLTNLKTEETTIAAARAPLQLAALTGDDDAKAESDKLRAELGRVRNAMEDLNTAIGQARFRLAAAEKDEELERKASLLAKAKELAHERVELAQSIDAAFVNLQQIFDRYWSSTHALSHLADVTGVSAGLLRSSHRVDRALWHHAPAFTHYCRLPMVKPSEEAPLAVSEANLIRGLLGRTAPVTELDTIIATETEKEAA